MKKQENVEVKIIFVAVCLFFVVFLLIPLLMIVKKSFVGKTGISFEFYRNIVTGKNIKGVFLNSIFIALSSALVTTILAFILAYSVHFTNIHQKIKKIIQILAVAPMLLPTITYGFAIIYSLGRQGFLTRIFGFQLFNIYGLWGLLIGYVIYTLPVSFILLNNAMSYIDKKFLVVSRVMGDRSIRTVMQTILRPLTGTVMASVVQCFFLSFTDFGIPASVGGSMEVIAQLLYNEMLGSIPNFNNGAVVSLMMVFPSAISIGVLIWLEQYNIRYNKISQINMKKSVIRDVIFGLLSGMILLGIISIFAVILIVPFVEEWPYRMTFTTKHLKKVLTDTALITVVKNSMLIAFFTSVVGSVIVYGAALVTARSSIGKKYKRVIESISLTTNALPGMVLGIAFLLTFSGTSLHNTFVIIVFCNVIHFFSTPYLMMKNALEKMCASWEVTARLLGDNWLKTIVRVVTPNASSTLMEVFSYYFVNSMVTVSAVVFIAGARTMVMTIKIKELQHYVKYSEIFVLSLLILLINVVMKGIFGKLIKSRHG